MTDYDDDDDNVENDTVATGFCHMNENGSSICFNINLFGKSLEIFQAPDLPPDIAKDVGHGAVVWDAAVIFTKYLEISSKFSGSTLQNKRVIELGAGTGLAGLAFMLKGAFVTLTDTKAVIDHITKPNAESIYSKNNISSHLHKPICEEIDWNQEYPALNDSIEYDYCLLTDCVFSVDFAPKLVQQLVRVCNLKTQVIVCHEIRDEEANQLFLDHFSKYFKVKKVSMKKLHPDYKNDLVILLEGKKKRS